jgi:hypothetical protein
MVKHIVMLQLKDYPNKTQKLENALQLKKALEHMKVFIDEIKYIEVGLNFSVLPFAYDLVLTTTFNSELDLEKYMSHPEHKKVLVFLNQVTEKKAVVDYEI